MGVSRVPRPEACRLRLATHRGPERDQQDVPNAQDYDGDPAVSTFDRQAMRLVGQLRPQGRFLLPRDRTPTQRMFHCQLGRQGAAILRATNGLEPKPFCC